MQYTILDALEAQYLYFQLNSITIKVMINKIINGMKSNKIIKSALNGIYIYSA